MAEVASNQYHFKRLGDDVIYEFDQERLRAYGKSRLTGRYDVSVPLASLDSEPNQFWLRERRKWVEWVMLSWVLGLIPVLVVTMPRSEERWARMLTVGYWILFALLAGILFLRSTIHVVVFNRSGAPAFTLYAAGRYQDNCPAFIDGVKTAIKTAQSNSPSTPNLHDRQA